jgi:hypothetical protein
MSVLEVVKTETALDVLSRAACMMESGITYPDIEKNGLKRTMTNCESQLSDFALSKCRRLDQHHDNNSGAICPLSDANSGRKCAGTQTLFSSFVPVPNFYPQPPPPPPPPTSDPCLHDTTNEDEPRFILDLDRHMARSSHPLHAGMRRGSTPPPMESESSNAPLNLTLSSSSKSGLRSPVSRDVQCGQWSVSRGDPHYEITWSASDERDYIRPSVKAAPDFCKTMPCKTMLSNNNNNHNNNRQPPTQHKIWALTNDNTRPSPTKTKQGTSPRKVTSVVTVECDRDIEEHFQRSLGKDYPKCLAAKNKQNTTTTTTPEAPTAPAPLVAAPASMVASPALRNGTTPHTPPANNAPETSQVNVTVSGSVDDHFAKSLGQTWTRLKSQTSQTSPEAKSPEPGSVDDHFAKALGETWFKLRVKKEGT